MRRILSVVAGAAVATLLGAAPARADLIPTLTSVTGAGPFVWTYTTTLTSDEIAQTGAVPGATTPTALGSPGSAFADYYTIYDFAGFIPGSNTQPAGWAFQSLSLGSTPSTVIPTDSASIPNLTWYYVGDAPLVGPVTGMVFTASSIFSNRTNVNFSSDATKSSNGFADANIGTTQAPSAVPEPASMTLLGTGLLGLVRVARRRRQAV